MIELRLAGLFDVAQLVLLHVLNASAIGHQQLLVLGAVRGVLFALRRLEAAGNQNVETTEHAHTHRCTHTSRTISKSQ